MIAFGIHSGELHLALNDNINTITVAAKDTLSSAVIRADKLDRIMFTGGSSWVPSFKSSIRNIVPNAAVSDDHVFDAMGLGLTLDAANRFY